MELGKLVALNIDYLVVVEAGKSDSHQSKFYWQIRKQTSQVSQVFKAAALSFREMRGQLRSHIPPVVCHLTLKTRWRWCCYQKYVYAEVKYANG